MLTFLCASRPRSANKNRKYSSRYKDSLEKAIKKYFPSIKLLEDQLYGSVYYFHSVPTQIDADNLSKPIWDALEGVVYKDDSIIKLRHAGIVDLKAGDFHEIDLTDLPDIVTNDFFEMIDNEEHFLYIEIGLLKPNMFTFMHSE